MGLTWKNVPSQNNAALVQTLLNAGKRIGGGISDLGTVAEEFAQKKTDDETAKLLAAISTEENPAVRQTMIDAASAQSDFLDFDKIRTVSWELGAADRAEDLATFKDKIADQNALDLFNRQQTLEKEAQANRILLSDHDLENEFKAADKTYLLTKKALDDNFAREKEETEAKVAADLETQLTSAANEQAILTIKENAANELKEALELLENNQEIALQELENQHESNKTYLSDIKNQPSGLQGIYKNAAGGLDPTKDNVGYTKNDTAAYNSIRARIFKELQITPSNHAEIDKFDRWAAQNISFNDNSIFGGLNDFSFYDLGNEKVNLGKGWQTTDRGITLLLDTYNEHKTALDIKIDLHNWYQGAAAKADFGGSDDYRQFDIIYQRLKQQIYEANYGDKDPTNDINFNAATARDIFKKYLKDRL